MVRTPGSRPRMPVITRTPETSESATKRFSPSVARPLGCAKLAEANVPSRIFSTPDPAKTLTVSEPRSSFQI